MTAKEAYNIFKEKFVKMDAIKCTEYKSRFVFLIAPQDTTGVTNTRLMSSLLCVVKDTKEVCDFKPFHIPIDEYKAGKSIQDFKS